MDYTAASALSDMDTLAEMYALLDPVFGDGTVDGTCSMGAQVMFDRAVADLSVEEWGLNALLLAYKQLAEACKTATAETGYTKTVPNLLTTALRALQSACDGNIDTFLTSEVMRAHPNFNLLHYAVLNSYLTPANVFPPVVELGRVDRGASLWTFTDGALIAPATDHYGAGQIEAYVPPTYTIGGANCTLTATCKLASGTTETKAFTVPSGSVAGFSVALGSASNIYVDMTAVAETGSASGTSGDRIAFRTILLRDISDACDAPA